MTASTEEVRQEAMRH
jgi:hypothetical protein